MIDQPSFLPDQLDWDALPDGGIKLSSEQIDRAVQISQAIPNAAKQWQTYLNVLATMGVREWLEEWASDLDITETQCSIHQPQYAGLVDAACNLQVGRFTLCLIAVSRPVDAIAHFPKAAIDLPQFVPHFYVLVEVLEEELLARVYGYLRHDQLVEHQQSHPLSASSNWTHSLPLSWFNPDPNALLLELRCLEPGAISLPATSPQAPISAAQLQEKLTVLSPQLRSPLCSLEHLLTWDEAATILMQPDLAVQFYQMQQAVPDAVAPAPVLSNMTQHAINVGLWFRDQLDTVAQELSWVLMPALTPSTSALRSAVGELESVSSVLASRGVVAPSEARAAYRDLHWGWVTLRLYVVTWELPSRGEAPEWTLLLILGPQEGTEMPGGVRLMVQDMTQLLAEQVTTGAPQDHHLYAQVVGTLDEQFWITVDLTQGARVSFAFEFNSSE